LRSIFKAIEQVVQFTLHIRSLVIQILTGVPE